jgi:hypothetical protein
MLYPQNTRTNWKLITNELEWMQNALYCINNELRRVLTSSCLMTQACNFKSKLAIGSWSPGIYRPCTAGENPRGSLCLPVRETDPVSLVPARRTVILSMLPSKATSWSRFPYICQAQLGASTFQRRCVPSVGAIPFRLTTNQYREAHCSQRA